MSATKRGGVTADPSRILAAKKAAELSAFLLSEKGSFSEQALTDLDKMIQAVSDGFGFKVEILKPQMFAAFLEMSEPSQRVFNQLASELEFWVLLDEIEETCFGNPEILERARVFISKLWQNEVAANPFALPKDWRYLPVPEAIEAYRKIFGSSVNADAILKLPFRASPPDSQGIPVWIKLTTLARLFEIEGNPLEARPEGREAYARVVEIFVSMVSEAYCKVKTKFGFTNHRQGALTAKHVVLTPAGLATWQELERQSEGDFVIGLGGASTGSWYAGSSVRRSRFGIVLAGNHMPQDCVMTGGTIATQPDRLTRFEDLGLDCPGNAYAPDADGRFTHCVHWNWHVVRLHFGFRFTGHAYQSFGAAVLRRP